MKCKKCGNIFFICNIQLINFDGSLVVDGTTGIIDVKITSIAKYKRNSKWACAKCKTIIIELRLIEIVDKSFRNIG